MKIVESKGRLDLIETGDGEPIAPPGIPLGPVRVVMHYKVRYATAQALDIDIYGYNLLGFGRKARVTLDNGIVLTGRAFGGTSGFRRKVMSRCRMVDVSEQKIALPAEAPDNLECDRVVVPLTFRGPLAYAGCTTYGYSVRPGHPFSMTEYERLPEKGTWASSVLRLVRGDVEIIIAESNGYWRQFFDQECGHDRVLGLRSRTKQCLAWDDINATLDVMGHFLGWVGSCMTPFTQIRAYRKGRVVLREWNVTPCATPPVAVGWMPMSNINQQASLSAEVQALFDGFEKAWTTNKEKRSGTLHLALQYRRSKTKPVHGDDVVSVMHLHHAVTACWLLLAQLAPLGNIGSARKMSECLKLMGIPDVMPVGGREAALLREKHSWIWGRGRRGKLDREAIGTKCMSLPLANVRDKVIHIDEHDNALKIMDLPTPFQHLVVEVYMWLADLLMLKIVEYNGVYHNRINGRTEMVPWAPSPQTNP